MIGKSCSSLFRSASPSIWWSVGSHGVLLLLENGVARNEGGGNTGGEGEWGMEHSLCLKQVLHQLLVGKGCRLLPSIWCQEMFFKG